MKTRQEQKEIEKHLKLVGRLYDKIDALKAENKGLKQQVKKLNKPVVMRSVCKCGNQLTEKELFYEMCLQCNDVVIAN